MTIRKFYPLINIMKRHVKKQLTFIQIGLLLLTVIGTKVRTADKQQNKLLNKLSTVHIDTVCFATVLHNIDMSSCYTWLTNINQSNAHNMLNALMAQLWKIVCLGVIGWHKRVNIAFWYTLLSKLIIEILAQPVYNTKLATVLSYWPLGLAIVHWHVQKKLDLNSENKPYFPHWGKCYAIFITTLTLYHICQQCHPPLSKIIIGTPSQTSKLCYLFDLCFGVVYGILVLLFSDF